MNSTTQTEREAFEQWALKTQCNQEDLQRGRLTGYAMEELNLMWVGWNGRAQLAAKPAEVTPPDPSWPSQVKPEDHPDGQAMRWSDCEIRWISARDAKWTHRLEGLRRDFSRECADGDAVLRLLGIDPGKARTDGGSLNLARIGSLLQASRGVVPDGWKLVPVVPTPDMIRAAQAVPEDRRGQKWHGVHKSKWAAMLTAAPAAQQGMDVETAYQAADALYKVGYEHAGRHDYDPRGTEEWQRVVDMLEAAPAAPAVRELATNPPTLPEPDTATDPHYPSFGEPAYRCSTVEQLQEAWEEYAAAIAQAQAVQKGAA